MTSAQIARLKALAHHLEPSVQLGKEGVSDGFVKSVNQALDANELIKVQFVAFKEEKKVLSPVIAEKTQSVLVTRVGNVAVLYRPHPDEAKRKISLG